MHDAARSWVARHAIAGSVLEIGGRDINGTVREFFGAGYIAIDLYEGPGVDIVGDVCEWKTRRRFDVVVCCEVLEHTEAPIIEAARRLLRNGGTLILTAAGPGREPHSSIDGGPLRDGEFYRNVTEPDLRRMLKGWRDVTINIAGDDIRAVATK